MEFSGQEYWNGLPFSSPRDLPNPGIEHRSPELQADYLPLSHQGSLVDMSHIYFIHSSVDVHLGCFHTLAIVKSVSVKIGIHVSFLIYFLIEGELFYKEHGLFFLIIPSYLSVIWHCQDHQLIQETGIMNI